MDIMDSAGYFTTYDYPPYVDETPNEAALGKNLQGKVEFDLGELMDPVSGTLVRVKGEFPRIQPRQERDSFSEEELSALKAKLTAWTDAFFETAKQPKYFEELVDVCSIFTLYVNPFHEIDDTRMELVLKSFFWIWHQDDYLELAIKHNVPFNIMEKGLAQLRGVLEDEVTEFIEVEGCPGFRPLFNSLKDVHAGLQRNAGKTGSGVSESFQFYLRRYFECMKWFSVERIDGSYSEETFKFWRRDTSLMDLFAHIIIVVNSVVLPERIFTSPLLRRIIDITNSSGSFANDLLGLAKELKFEQFDNLVMFKVVQKRIPLQDAVAQVCGLVTDEHKDYILLRDAILFKFSNDPELVKCIDVLESVLDGHFRIYARSRRHLSATKVTLTR